MCPTSQKAIALAEGCRSPRFASTVRLGAVRASGTLAGWIGEIRSSCIDDEVRLRFRDGGLSEIEPWQGARADEAWSGLMQRRFEALVFGYRSLAAILDEDADCAADEETEAVLAAIFPPGDSFLRPI